MVQVFTKYNHLAYKRGFEGVLYLTNEFGTAAGSLGEVAIERIVIRIALQIISFN